MTQPTIDPHIVVCTDLHAAFGIYTSLRSAVAACRRMQDYDTCSYRPVRIKLGDNVEYFDTSVPDTPEGIEFKNRGGGYL